MVSDDAGHGIYLGFNEIGSACAAVPVVPVAEKRGMYNLDLSKANAETSLGLSPSSFVQHNL